MPTQAPACTAADINLQAPDLFLKSLAKADKENVTNAVILEIYNYLQKQKKSKVAVTWINVIVALGEVFQQNVQDMSSESMRSAVVRLKKQRSNLVKLKLHERGSLMETFLADKWCLPLSKQNKKRTAEMANISDPSVPEVLPKYGKFDKFRTDVQEETLNKLAAEVTLLKEKIHLLETENVRLKTQNNKLREQVKICNPKRVNQMMKRRNHSKLMWKKRFQGLSQSLKTTVQLKKKLKEATASLSMVKSAARTKVKRVQQSKAKLQQSQTEHVNKVNQICSARITEEKKEVDKLKGNLKFIENELDMTKCSLNEEFIETKVGGKAFTSGVREASYHLQNMGISQQNVSEALRLVTKALTGQNIGDLPSYTTQNSFTKEMKALSRQQVREGLENAKDCTIKYDGTTKKLGQLVEVEISTKDETYLLGVREQASGKAESYIETIMDTLHTVENTHTPIIGSKSLDILSEVANTMTDRCQTNKAVDHKLEHKKGSTINQFRCAMHPLDTFAKDCDKAVKHFEVDIDLVGKRKGARYPYSHRNESSTQALVRTSAKLFHDTQYNCDQELVKHLKNENVVPTEEKGHTVIYPRFVGNRFHIYFLCSGVLFHYANNIVNFFLNIFPPKNDVQHAVLNALQVQEQNVSLRALGIVGKLITAPWMRLVGHDKTILEMNTYFHEAQVNLMKWAEDASPLMSPNPPSIFKDIGVKEDIVLHSLLEPLETVKQSQCLQLVQDMCHACLAVIERQLQSQLPGGAFWDPSPQMQTEAESCASTNISGERNFAIADQQILRACQAKLGYIEAKVMFKVNKTGSWINKQHKEERTSRLNLAMKQAREITADDKQRKERTDKLIQDRLLESRKEMLKKEDKERGKFEKYLQDMFDTGGIWQNSDEMEHNLRGFSKTKAMNAVKAQINVRTKMLKCVDVDKIVLGKCSLSELKDYLGIVMHAGMPAAAEDWFDLVCNPRSLVGCSFIQKWVNENDKVQWFEGEFVALEIQKKQAYFKANYNDNSVCFLTLPEVIVDIYRGDLDIANV